MNSILAFGDGRAKFNFATGQATDRLLEISQEVSRNRPHTPMRMNGISTQFRHRLDLDRRANHKHLASLLQIHNRDSLFPDLEAPRPSEHEDMAFCDAVQKAVRHRRYQHPTFHQNDICRGRFGNITINIQQQGIIETRLVCSVPGQSPDHIKAGTLGGGRGRVGARAAPRRELEAHSNIAFPQCRRSWPIPGSNGNVNGRVAGRYRNTFTASPGDRAYIGVFQFIRPKYRLSRLFQFKTGIGNGIADNPRGITEPCEMCFGEEYLSVVSADSLEYCSGGMQRMCEDVNTRICPRHKRPVEPDQTITIAERKHGFVALGFGEPWLVSTLPPRSCSARVSNPQSRLRYHPLRQAMAGKTHGADDRPGNIWPSR